MPNKRIVVCCDGTSNTAFSSIQDSPRTNVHRIWRYIRTSTEYGKIQVKFYHSGIGTAPGSWQTRNQALAIGFPEKVMEAYGDICGNYRNGDEIILFGYSRGAYTIRCLINLIDEVGLLTLRGLRDVHTVFHQWWNNEDHLKIRGQHDFIEPKSQYPIKACGLWDTVNSVGVSGLFGHLGISGSSYSGPNSLAPGETSISGVEFAFHALSLHESRSPFRPEIISGPGGQGWSPRHIEQCWFSGYHGDIGGGRKDDALALLPLAWMMVKMYEYVEFDFELFWEDDSFGSTWTTHPVDVADSMTSLYRMMGRHFRTPGLAPASQQTRECIHRSVYQLTFPGASRPPSQDPPLNRWKHPPVMPPCEALKDISQLAANGNPPRMTWIPTYQSSSLWPFSTGAAPPAVNPVIETGDLPAESSLIRRWVGIAHAVAQRNAVAGDEGTNFFRIMLQDIFELPVDS